MMSTKINILTYDITFHKKTYDTINLLKASGYNNVEVFAIPHHYVKKHKPLILHRPEDFGYIANDLSMEQQCRNFAYKLTKIANVNDINYTSDKGGAKSIFSLRCRNSSRRIY